MRFQTIAAVCLFALVTTTAAAQDRPAIFRYAHYEAMVAGNTADLWTTVVDIHTGQLHEGNGFLRGQGARPIVIAKVVGVAVIAIAMRALEAQGHPRVAKVLGYLDGGVTTAAAYHNNRLRQSLR